MKVDAEALSRREILKVFGAGAATLAAESIPRSHRARKIRRGCGVRGALWRTARAPGGRARQWP